ncbi:MAG: hypothetical protein M5R40_07360 [Anaerolineae bacterium]|nr:hypothetical protein [Anaerolineae bacterium]
MEAFADAGFVHDAGQAILDVLKSMYTFVIVDIGQDYNLPLHAAALKSATEVLVPIPPVTTAVVDLARALPALRGYFGNLGKFRWLPTAWREGGGKPVAQARHGEHRAAAPGRNPPARPGGGRRRRQHRRAVRP